MTQLPAGVWGVLPTPFEADTLAVDTASVSRLVDLYRDLGATGVVALGVFGEAAQLTPSERIDVLSAVCDAAGDLGVVAGIADLDTAVAAEESRRLAGVAGGRLDAVMVQANSGDPSELRRHFGTVHEACDTPIVVQDYPLSSGVRVSTAALVEALDGAEWVAAVKGESPPTSWAIGQLADAITAPLFGGLGGVGLLDELMAGAAGAMTGFSHPEALLATVAAWRDGGYAAARAAIEPWLPLINFEAQQQVGLAIRKENFRRRGLLDAAAVRPPARELPPELVPLLDAHWTAATALVG